MRLRPERLRSLARLLVAALVLVLAAGAADLGVGGASASSPADAIQVENSRPGTTAWFIPTPRQDEIEGYFGNVSYAPGGNATLYVNSHGDAFSYTVYRMGYYQGLGGREVAAGPVAANAPQPDPTVSGDFDLGPKLLTTGWHSSAVIPLAPDWVSGFYLVKLHDDANGGESYANFVLRSASPAPIVIDLSTNTWEAYNRWGNLSLYRDARDPAASTVWDIPHRVSFQRPYLEEGGAGKFFLYARPLVEWAESHGYPVSYSADEDVRHGRVAGPDTKLVIFSGHTEYYSMADRTEVERLTAAGVSEAFFGGNSWAWQARFDDSRHTMTVWRKAQLDPERDPQLKTVRWESIGLPQDEVTGTMETWGSQTGPQAAYATASWPWRGAGVVSGEDLGPVEGGERDGLAVNPEMPRNVIMLSRTPFSGMPNVPADQAMTLWQKTPSAFVFSGGQTGFNWNLDYPGVAPARWIDAGYPATSQVKPPVERLVGNLIERATGIANPIEPIASPPAVTPFHLLSPQTPQDIEAAPNPLSVAWSDPPERTATLEVVVDGTPVANTTGPRNVLVADGISRLGWHRITVLALAKGGRVLASASARVDVLSHTDRTFRHNAIHVNRQWG